METSPVVLFVYNRPWHTRQTVEALAKNTLANETRLFIYSDAAASPKETSNVAEVRDYISSIEGFREVEITLRKKNTGLAMNITSGVSEILRAHKRVIVLEDDIVTSTAFLTFMNKALDYYKNNEKVWHISGWNYPIDPAGMEDTFFYRVMNCWGWATWEDRWCHFDKNPDELLRTFTKKEISRFDLEGCGGFWKQVVDNSRGKINTWAIFWYATIFRHNAFCLNPTVSYVRNIGHDGSGEHCIESTSESTTNLNEQVPRFHDNVVESDVAVEKIMEYYRNTGNRRYASVINAARSYAKRFFR